MKYTSMHDVLNHQPRKVGLRGDAYLYFEMEKYFEGVDIPSKDGFATLIAGAFKFITEISINSTERVFVEELAHGGMSSGVVDPVFWKNEVIPYLYKATYGSDFKSNEIKL